MGEGSLTAPGRASARQGEKGLTGLLQLSRLIDSINERIGKLMSWAILGAVLVSSINATIRFAFNQSSNAWLELQWYLFGAVFLLGSAYTFQKNEHIRIDIINSRMPVRVRHWIDIVGHLLFLTPFCLIMIWLGSRFFWRSFQSGEGSSSAGGLTVWPAKLLIPLGFALLLAQGMSELIKRVAVMQGRIPDPHAGTGGHSAETELIEAISTTAPHSRNS